MPAAHYLLAYAEVDGLFSYRSLSATNLGLHEYKLSEISANQYIALRATRVSK